MTPSRTLPHPAAPDRTPVVFKNIDLHLLACFDALMTEQQVTRAAERMGMSQPAMSNALGRLRALFGDPLLVRTPRGMVATPRALDLVGEIRHGLRRIEDALTDGAPFDPAAASQTMTVMTTDYAAEALMPALMATLSGVAPNLKVAIQAMSPSRIRESLEAGDTHLAIGYFRDLPSELFSSTILTRRIVCVARSDHPGIGETLGLSDYVRLRHAYFQGFPHGEMSTTEKATDMALAELGLQRDVVFRSGNVLVLLPLVAETDLVATIPHDAAMRGAGRFGLRVMPLPFAVPDLDLSIVWHGRTHRDKAQQWFRSVIREIARRQNAPARGGAALP